MAAIERVAVVGSGTMGRQIAIQIARGGVPVALYDVDSGALERAREAQHAFVEGFVADGTLAAAEAAPLLARIRYDADLGAATRDADLIIEAVPEQLALKRQVFAALDEHAPEGAIIATNSSSLRVSLLEDATARPERCANFHFYIPVWDNPMVEVGGGTRTDPAALDALDAFARRIGLLPLRVLRESTGFIFNRVWRAIKKEVLAVADGGIASFEDIDRAWMIHYRTPKGPFGKMDEIGLDVVQAIEEVYAAESNDPADRPPPILTARVARGDLGQKSGRGFYSYPDPAWAAPSFLAPEATPETHPGGMGAGATTDHDDKGGPVSTVAPDPADRQPPTFALDAPDDVAFAAQAPIIGAYLRANFPGLAGLPQHRPHFHPELGRTTDPIEHTLEVLTALDTSGLDPADARLLRAATVFHDIGKLLDPFNVRHASDSAIMAVPYLTDFALTQTEQDDALAVVRNHDVLGRVCQGRLTADEALDLLGTPRLADLTARLTRADVGSIRGLARVLPSILAAETAVQALFTARRYSQRFDLPGERSDAVAAILPRLTPRVKLWLEIGDDLGLLEWRVALLEAVDRTGSLASAAERLNIPYRTARYKLREIERHLGLPLLEGQSGGAGGGRSVLTPAARELIARWRAFSNGLDPIVAERFRATFRAQE